MHFSSIFLVRRYTGDKFVNNILDFPRTVDMKINPILRFQACLGTVVLSVQEGRQISTCSSGIQHICIKKYPTLQHRSYCSKFENEDSDLDDDDTEDVEGKADQLLEDNEYNHLVREYSKMPDAGHRVFVVQPVSKQIGRRPKDTTGELQLAEAVALVNSIPKWTVVKTELMNVVSMEQEHVFGKGQLERLTETINRPLGITAVFVCVNHLKNRQLNKLQNKWQVPVLDRYAVVIQIFKTHAKTKEAKLQVALAEIPHIRARLLEIQDGVIDTQTSGADHVGGYGNFIPHDRNVMLQRRERRLSKALEAVKKQRTFLRERRIKRRIPTVAVIGYTNCGKTTLIKALTGDEDMVPCNQLFATLDVTSHAGYLPNRMSVLYIDTVGFITNIPSSLLSAFSATLEDALSADLIVHVCDVSNPDRVSQRKSVKEMVRRMLSPQKFDSMIEIWNKVDKLESVPEDIRKESDTNVTNGHKVFHVSAVTGEGLHELQTEIKDRILRNMGCVQKKVRVPMNGSHLRWLYRNATVVSTEEDSDPENLIVNIVINSENYSKFTAAFGKPQTMKCKP